MIGEDGTHDSAERSAGITAKVIELAWSSYEPSQGTFSSSYVASERTLIQNAQAAGFSVILSLGVQYTPAWVLSQPDAYYVDQYGDAYNDSSSGTERANLVWNSAIRSELAAYIAQVFSDFPTGIDAVRIGGGHYGELGYPPNGYNGHTNTYWAFDANAAASDPVPGWVPGDASPNGEATTFYSWYDQALTNYETWQIATYRAHFGGPLMLLEPGFGERPADVTAAEADNLDGASSAEVNGEVQTAHDYQAQVAAISDSNVWPDTTWLDSPYGNDAASDPAQRSPVGYLSYLDGQKGLGTYGENTGQGSASTLQFTNSQAVKFGLQGFAWFNEQQLFSGSYATLSDYQAVIQGSGSSGAPAGFLQASGTSLTLDGQPFTFSGFNIYNANSRSNCGSTAGTGTYMDTALSDIAALPGTAHSHTIFRSWFFQDEAITNGAFDFSAFDHTLQVAAAHGDKVIVTLANQWGSCDGGNYLYDSWYTGGYKTTLEPGWLTDYRDWVQQVVTRYKDNSAVAMWQLMNEAEVKLDGTSTCAPASDLYNWASDVSGLIKSIDPYHLVNIGTMGGGQCGTQGSAYQNLYSLPNVDVVEYHDYNHDTEGLPTNMANDIAAAKALGKPIIAGEVGIQESTSGSYTTRADELVAKDQAQFNDGIAGFLVWSWNNGAEDGTYKVGPGDPLLSMDW